STLFPYTTLFRSTTVQTVSGLANATAITAGTSHTCAVLSDGSVSCWGTNRKGELGNGSSVAASAKTFQATPSKVKGLRGSATTIGAGDNHTLCSALDGRSSVLGQRRT